MTKFPITASLTITVIGLTFLILINDYQTTNSINELKNIIQEEQELSDFKPKLSISNNDDIILTNTPQNYQINQKLSIKTINKNPIAVRISDIKISEYFRNDCYFKTAPTIDLLGSEKKIIGIESKEEIYFIADFNYHPSEFFNTSEGSNDFHQYLPVTYIVFFIDIIDIKTNEKYEEFIGVHVIAPFSKSELEVIVNCPIV